MKKGLLLFQGNDGQLHAAQPNILPEMECYASCSQSRSYFGDSTGSPVQHMKIVRSCRHLCKPPAWPRRGLRDASCDQVSWCEQIRECGGAIHVEAAHSFCVVLTQSGRVFLCGRLPDLPGPGLGSGLTIWHFDCKPTVKQIAAGSNHVLMSDGEQVWTVGLYALPSIQQKLRQKPF